MTGHFSLAALALLDAPFTALEVFFQDIWDPVGGDMITEVCLSILNGGKSIKLLNHTFVALIPKIKSPKKVADFRPISLCDVSYI